MSVQVLTGAALVAGALPVAWWAVSSQRPGSGTAAALRRGFAEPVNLRDATLQGSARERAIDPIVAALAARARRLTPAGWLSGLDRRLAAAGMRGQWTIERVLAAKLGLAIIASVIGVLWWTGSPSIMNLVFVTAFVALAWFGPDVILHGRADDRRKAVQRELPDTMDQITIAVEAGLGFEAAMARVAANGGTVLNIELARTLQDIQLGLPRTDALEGLSDRCDVGELRHFVTAIRQAERYGLPIANVLRVQSSELRDKRRQRAEEHAMKIPVKVLFPLVFCILPTLFIVVIGPGVIRIMENLGA